MRLHRSGRSFARCLALALVGSASLPAQSTNPSTVPTSSVQPPSWAMPFAPAPPAPVDSLTAHRVPGSRLTFIMPATHDRFNVADWYPESHPPMPPVVAHGRRPAVFACAYCHLPDGMGRPENAMLAGLPVDYFIAQVADMRSRARQAAWHVPNSPADVMRGVADSATTSEVAVAARYFAKLKAHRRSRVVEAERIPRVRAGAGLYLPAPEGGEEPLGQRLVELATDVERHELHDARAEYVAYVPVGSIARGRTIATAGAGPAVPSCTSCHGPRLRGMGVAPPIAGRAPSYLLRQLLAFATGARAAPAAAPMRAVVAGLTLDDMIAAAAYAGSRAP